MRRTSACGRDLALLVLSALGTGLAVLGPLGCEGVPDLHFGAGAEDANASGGDAAMVTAPDSGSTFASPDATVGPPPSGDAGGTDGSSAPDARVDATAPVDAGGGPEGCPNHPPNGVTCCGPVECKGNANQCNCKFCQQACGNQGVCCTSPPQCATSLNACH